MINAENFVHEFMLLVFDIAIFFATWRKLIKTVDIWVEKIINYLMTDVTARLKMTR